MLLIGFSHFFTSRHIYKIMFIQHQGNQGACLWPKDIKVLGSRLWLSQDLPSCRADWGNQYLGTPKTHRCRGHPLENSSPQKLHSLLQRSLLHSQWPGVTLSCSSPLYNTTGHYSRQVAPAHCLLGGLTLLISICQ